MSLCLNLGANTFGGLMELVLLADHPNVIDKVASWYFKQWGDNHPEASLASVRQTLSQFTHKSAPPILVLARDKHDFVGAAQLKLHDMAAFPEYEYWISGVYVDLAYRNTQMMSLLINAVLAKARELGITHLYLKTEKLDGGHYRALGFKSLKTLNDNGRRILIMEARVIPVKVSRYLKTP